MSNLKENSYLHIFIIIITAFIILMYFLFTKSAEMDKKIGDEIIINKDTLMIIETSLFFNQAKLSNGTWIDYDLAVKLLKEQP